MTQQRPRRWDASDLSGARLGRYCRASHDDDDMEKSVTDQDDLGLRWGERNDCIAVHPTYVDNDISASYYGKKARDGFDRLLTDIAAGKLDLLWLWDLSRSNRRLDVYVRLRDLCRAQGVGWVIDGRIFDLNDPMDLQSLGYDAVNNEVFSVKLSKNVRRGQTSSAARGKPHGKLNYGYRRVYDHRGRYVEQLPDDALREAIGRTGESYWYSPAGIVREIFERVAAGGARGAFGAMAADFEARGIPTPRGGRGWARVTLRQIAMCPAYLGLRVRNGEVLDHEEPCWPSLIADDQARAEEIFYAVQNILTDPKRRTTRTSAKVKYLLSHIARCGGCGEKVRADRSRPGSNLLYVCKCHQVSIIMDVLDRFVEKTVVRYLARADVYEHLMAADGNDSAVMSARAEAERLRGEVEKWRRLGEEGTDAITVARSIKGLQAKIAEETEKAEAASIPPVLRGRIGPDAESGWKAIGDMATKRDIIRVCVEIQVNPVGKNAKGVTPSQRLTWRWLVGPEQQAHDMPLAEPIHRSAAAYDAIAEQQARDMFADVLAAGKLPRKDHLVKSMHVGDDRARRVLGALSASIGGPTEIAPRGRRIVTDDVLREVAEVYRAHESNDVFAALREHFDRSDKCVRLYVERARAAGFLREGELTR